jgi:hypothetical protein
MPNHLVQWSGLGSSGVSGALGYPEHATTVKVASSVLSLGPGASLTVFAEVKVSDRWITIATLNPQTAPGVQTATASNLPQYARNARLRWEVTGGLVGEVVIVLAVA